MGTRRTRPLFLLVLPSGFEERNNVTMQILKITLKEVLPHQQAYPQESPASEAAKHVLKKTCWRSNNPSQKNKMANMEHSAETTSECLDP